jgi:type 1 glutamine amidotransferase
MRLVTLLTALAGAIAAATAALAAPIDCPMADQPYSMDSPLIDVLLDPGAREQLDQADLLEGFPASFLKTEAPSFAAIVTPRQLAELKQLPSERTAQLDQALRRIAVTAQARRARCARYDEEAPHLAVPPGRPRILLFEKINGFRDGPSLAAAHAAVAAMAARRGWSLTTTDNGAAFTPDSLKRFDAVVWNNISGDVLTLSQRAALKIYVEGGGGFAGFHGSGGDPAYFWDWYADDLIGARFLGHPDAPQFQTGRLVVEDRTSPITHGLPASWSLLEEWYSFKASPRPKGAHVLVSLDESSYVPTSGGRSLRMGDHPIAWTRCVGAGRSFYSAIGHRPENYSEPNSTALLEGGIAWAAGLKGADCGVPPGRQGKD